MRIVSGLDGLKSLPSGTALSIGNFDGFHRGHQFILRTCRELIGKAGQVALGTVCSVTLNGVLLSHRIPATSRFGGVLELVKGEPVRFTDVISYDGTSLDPMEVFIKSGLTRVRSAAASGNGRIGASFREVPSCALDEVKAICQKLAEVGLGQRFVVGRPNQPLLGFPVPEGRTGLIVTGGLNPLAAVEESGIPTQNFALCQLYEFEQLHPYPALATELGVRLP